MNTKIIAIAALATATLASASPSFEVEVTGSGQPMILIPGLACNGSTWDETVERYQDRYECHVLSLAGFAGTAPIEHNGAFLETVKTDLIAYIQNKHLENSILVGHSLGGFLSLQIAISAPDEISRILVVDSLPFMPASMNPNATVESVKARATGQRDAMSQGGQGENALRGMLQMMTTGDTSIERGLSMSLNSHGPTVAQAMYELNTTDIRNDLTKIQTPTLILGAWIAYQQFGSTKESTSAIFNTQYANHPNYTLEMSDHGRHFIMWDDPDFFFAQLDSFLK